MPCNDGLNTYAAPCPLYEGKNQDGKCRFGPVRSTATADNSTTLSSEFHHGYATCIEFDLSSEKTGAVNVRRCQPVRVNVLMHYARIIISLPCPRMTCTLDVLDRYKSAITKNLSWKNFVYISHSWTCQSLLFI